ncbi:MAG: MBOAT family protein [Prevotellaceae bacterium]|jgi:D-alanyl-lipoteichoic acid acyltransferase DltB (MBOAT superfamily)|nr:MBOAT family protein [Prevotellaceae bacterium]
MLFNSVDFAVFLPAVFLLYWLAFGRSRRWQNVFVVAASYLFYGWWDWRFLVLMTATTVCSYASGWLIQKYPHRARAAMVANIVVNLAILGFFKYYNFFVESFVGAFTLLGSAPEVHTLNIILPVGISFYTFQALSYSIDVYRKRIAPTRDAVAFFAFVSFFPQLVAGPIERAANLLPQFYKKRTLDYAQAVDGMRQMLWGLFKKMVVADNCAVSVNEIFGLYDTLPASTLAVGAVLFAFQIYGDFSGYSDIAIGAARLFGFSLMRNFAFPYFSRDIAEFWRRWHISLTTWFRDYLYIPLGGSRCAKGRVVRNTWIIFLVSGLWHGASWTFIAWGAYHALLFTPLLLLGKNRRQAGIAAQSKLLPSLGEGCAMLVTFGLVAVGWIIFRAESIGQAADYAARMCSPGLPEMPGMSGASAGKSMLAVLALVAVEWLGRRSEHALRRLPQRRAVRWGIYYVVAAAIIIFQGQQGVFIYFQF